MNMGSIREIGGLVDDMASHWLCLMPARKALIKRGGLNDAFIGKLLMGRWYNG